MGPPPNHSNWVMLGTLGSLVACLGLVNSPSMA